MRRADPLNKAEAVDPRKEPTIPGAARRKTMRQEMFPRRDCAQVAEREVKEMMARLVPKQRWTITSEETFMEGKTQ